MDGYLVIYGKLPKKDITNINHFLYGKILRKKDKKYYYPGFLDSLPYAKLANGCLFLKETDVTTLRLYHGLYAVKCTLDISTEMLYTARELKKLKYKNEFVKHL